MTYSEKLSDIIALGKPEILVAKTYVKRAITQSLFCGWPLTFILTCNALPFWKLLIVFPL